MGRGGQFSIQEPWRITGLSLAFPCWRREYSLAGTLRVREALGASD